MAKTCACLCSAVNVSIMVAIGYIVNDEFGEFRIQKPGLMDRDTAIQTDLATLTFDL